MSRIAKYPVDAALAAAGSYKNSGQRCTAVKRTLVQARVADAFVERLVARTEAWRYGTRRTRTSTWAR